ncbi:MAG: ribonuclease H family protein [Acholeplasmatales bacterium]|nr:ribonuclease H family protein [Acholeplasmatales bacterium]
MKKYYAIKSDDYKNVVESWDECKEIIKDLKAPKYKSFQTIEEANAFLNDKELKLKDNYKYMAYTDGSFDSSTNKYSFGCVLLMNGIEYTFKKGYEPDEFSSLRNVAGEIKGAGFIINYAINHNIDELHLYYDYIGIEKWYVGEWKAKSTIAIKYQEFAKEAKKKINVVFHKVKSHANDYYNEKVDKLAKEALLDN